MVVSYDQEKNLDPIPSERAFCCLAENYEKET